MADNRAMAAGHAVGTRTSVNAISRTQNALHETQIEHSHTLENIAQAVCALVTTATRHDQTLD